VAATISLSGSTTGVKVWLARQIDVFTALTSPVAEFSVEEHFDRYIDVFPCLGCPEDIT
jgi:hypothetical protein